MPASRVTPEFAAKAIKSAQEQVETAERINREAVKILEGEALNKKRKRPIIDDMTRGLLNAHKVMRLARGVLELWQAPMNSKERVELWGVCQGIQGTARRLAKETTRTLQDTPDA